MRFPLRQLSLTSVVRSALKRMNGEDVIPRVAGTVPYPARPKWAWRQS